MHAIAQAPSAATAHSPRDLLLYLVIPRHHQVPDSCRIRAPRAGPAFSRQTKTTRKRPADKSLTSSLLHVEQDSPGTRLARRRDPCFATERAESVSGGPGSRSGVRGRSLTFDTSTWPRERGLSATPIRIKHTGAVCFRSRKYVKCQRSTPLPIAYHCLPLPPTVREKVNRPLRQVKAQRETAVSCVHDQYTTASEPGKDRCGTRRWVCTLTWPRESSEMHPERDPLPRRHRQ